MAIKKHDYASALVAGSLAALLLAGCGGGGDAGTAAAPAAAAPTSPAPTPAAPTAAAAPAPPAPTPGAAAAPAASTSTSTPAGVSRLIVAGDSLADVGTFGLKATVQDSANPAGFPLFPELVAAAHGLPAGCSHYADNGAGGVIARAEPGCNNFAVAGGRILQSEGPQSIPFQLRDAAAAAGGRFNDGDLVLIDGGGNDASDLAAAYLVGTTGRSGMLAFLAFLGREVEVGDLLSTAPGDASLARSANLYMEKAADALVEAIAGHALERGATRVAVLNLPDITRTPRFSAAFDRLVQERGADEATAVRAAVRQAVGAFNARLQGRLGNDARVVLVDVRASVDDQIARPAAWGLTDAVHAACPVTGVSSAELPQWSLPTCTSAALDAAPPAGAAPGWWTTWAFADGFHPTPTGHRLLADTVNRAIAVATWP